MSRPDRAMHSQIRLAAYDLTELERELSQRVKATTATAVQAERQRLALELHDTIGAMLFAITAGVRNVSENTADGNMRKALLTIERQAREAAVTLRESLRALQSPAEQLALGAALQAVNHCFEARTGVKATLVMLDLLPAISENVVKILIAAAKEGLLNVEKHAHATEVAVTVASVKDGIALTITDNGVGITAAYREQREPEDHGFGLQAVSKVLADIGGTLHLNDNADGGTSFRAWIRI